MPPTSETFRIEGLDEAIRQFRRMPDVARKYIKEAVQVTEIIAAGKVRSSAPRDTGALAHAIGSKTVGLTASITIEHGHIYGRKPYVYWRFVEFGARGIPARPFIRTAAESETNPFIERVRKAAERMARTFK